MIPRDYPYTGEQKTLSPRYVKAALGLFERHENWTANHARNAFAFTTCYKNTSDSIKAQDKLGVMYKTMCRQWIHPNKYHKNKRKYLMPFLIAWGELDSSDQWHHHGILFFHDQLMHRVPDLLKHQTKQLSAWEAAGMDWKKTYKSAMVPGANTLKQFSAAISSSDFQRITNAEGWVAYSMNSEEKNDAHRFQFAPPERSSRRDCKRTMAHSNRTSRIVRSPVQLDLLCSA